MTVKSEPMDEYEFLSGSGFSGLSSLSRCGKDDQFLISRKQLRTESPKWWFSRRLAYSDLSARIAADLSAKFKFGSMAYESEDDYALSGHKHAEYNWVDVVSQYQDTREWDGTYDYGDDPPAVTVAKVWIDGVVKTVKVPLPVIKRESTSERPTAGQLKMMAVTSLAAIDVYAEDFDGWVYANGATYPSIFEHSSYFPQVAGGFQVPDIRNIIEMNNKPDDPVYAGKIGHAAVENDVAPHTHGVKPRMSGSATATITFGTGQYHDEAKLKGSHILTK